MSGKSKVGVPHKSNIFLIVNNSSPKTQTKYKYERRNPGKNDGYTYKSDAYLPPKDTIGEDQYDDDIYYEYDYMGRYLEGEPDYYEGELTVGADGVRNPGVAISLLDLAKPAKPRGMTCSLCEQTAVLNSLFSLEGLAKNFTVVPNVPRVLAIDDFQTDQESWENEDYDAWVDVPDFNRKSYASAVSKG